GQEQATGRLALVLALTRCAPLLLSHAVLLTEHVGPAQVPVFLEGVDPGRGQVHPALAATLGQAFLSVRAGAPDLEFAARQVQVDPLEPHQPRA
ncbi:hypothetical protein, partial [Corallococcus sp. AS-1-12]|nr:hypothetical protein [Corallococcus sp. AS-1-12]